MDDLPNVFEIPEVLRDQANEIRNQYSMSAVGLALAEKLNDIGCDLHIAFHVAVADLRVAAARLAVMACEIEKREPRKDLWMQRAEEDLDQAREWLARMQAESAAEEAADDSADRLAAVEAMMAENGGRK